MIQHGESNNNEQAKNVTTCVAVFPVQPTTVDVLEQVDAARTCFFGDHPEPRRMYQSMRNCEIGHESAEIFAWVENFRASTDHGGGREKFAISFGCSFARLANSRCRRDEEKSQSTHTRALRDTIDRFGKYGLKVRSPVYKVVRHDHECFSSISFMELGS